MRNIRMVFNEANGPAVEALSDFSLEVAEGQILGIVGPSGCGKTTILKIIAGLLSPTLGEVSVAGSSPLAARSQRAFSFMFQQPVLLPWLTVRQNVQLPGKLAAYSENVDKADGLLKLVGLDGFEDAFPRQLSGGMQARVALARALSFQPKLLLMDEPFGALDAMTRNVIQNEFLSIMGAAPTTTVIFVTHSIDEAVYLADRVVVLSSRPAGILLDLPIELMRPRSWATKDSPAFLSYRARIEGIIYGRHTLWDDFVVQQPNRSSITQREHFDA
jgi:NitT/TauT family transport system ATP-binding protein